MAKPQDRLPPIAAAMQWVSQITAVSLTMVLPAAAGHWADKQWGLSPWLLVTGATVGLVLGMMQLLGMVGKSKSTDERTRRRKDG
ncbi:MAG: AtpZ/AtpI family protein [Planctomycetales bacterium]